MKVKQMLNIGFSPAFENNNVPVVFVSSNMYAPYAGVFIQSLIDHSSSNHNYDIIIFEREISPENKRLLKLFERGRPNVAIRFYNPYYKFDGVVRTQEKIDFPLNLVCRILAPHILSEYDRLITVDTDTLLKKDIADLLNTDLEGYFLGGVNDILWEGGCRENKNYSSTIKIPIQDHCRDVLRKKHVFEYINGGLYLFNTRKYCENVPEREILKRYQEDELLFSDDMMLNVLCEGKIKFLNVAWNVQIKVNPHFEAEVSSASTESRQAYEHAIQDPYLLHWEGKPKPWVCPDVPFGSEWWQTALRTPFIGHIIARMSDEQAKRRAYYKKRYGTEDIDIWDPSPKGIKRVL